MPILDAHTFEFFSRSPEQTRRLGMRLGALLQQGDLICLQLWMPFPARPSCW
jgi:tRNA threonylcarbamoyladenosine biosynthesis protein TsaE